MSQVQQRISESKSRADFVFPCRRTFMKHEAADRRDLSLPKLNTVASIFLIPFICQPRPVIDFGGAARREEMWTHG